MSKALIIIEAIEALMNLAINMGVNIARYREMREANGGEPLTAEQRQALADEAQASIDRLPSVDP